jgi:YVTN family beta-propeller protein
MPIMIHRSPPRKSFRARLLPLLLPVAALPLMALKCVDLPQSGAQLFLSPESNPMALSEDGTRLYVANTTSGTLSVLDVSNPLHPSELTQIKVGMDPTGVAVLPGGINGDELVFVVNHISDTVSVVSRKQLAVVQTLQQLDSNGVTQTNEPVGVVFSDPSRAFVTLDEPNQVLVLDVDATGRATIDPNRSQIPAQAPRAIAAAGGKVFVLSFESGNQTEFPSCWPGTSAPTPEGCQFTLDLLSGLSLQQGGVQLGTIFQFAARNPNIGGKVIKDTDIPDRDLFVIDGGAAVPAVQQTLTSIGTLLSGIAVNQWSGGTRLYIAHTEARNQLQGLRDLDNRMFENRVAIVDCPLGPTTACAVNDTVDLDQSAAAAGLGQTVPTPWGIQASGDGRTVVLTAAGADGDPGDGRPPMHGLFTLDRDGRVLGSALVGALPEGVVLRSDPNGAAQVAYVLNTAHSSVSAVDVSDPSHPATAGNALVVGHDPTPPEIRLGRIAFNGARDSTSKTFSCGSCHPNGNIDQLQWVINTDIAPGEGTDANHQVAEPRTTMPIRQLSGTLPLHWEGTLADPFPGVNPNAAAFDSAPDCDITVVGEKGCVRHLVNAALAGQNCQHNGGGCVPGEGQTGPDGANLPGPLTEAERNAMAAFLLSVAFPPAPARRADDHLSAMANQGVSDFFTNEDGKGINKGVGQLVGFAPTTCADNPLGCHSLPLTTGTNSSVVGGFDAPSARGMWDRFTLFSDGIMSSVEGLRGAQDCANGIEPPAKEFQITPPNSDPITVEVTGDPCNLQSPLIAAFTGFPLATLPFPSHATIYDPAVGMTERGSFMATFEGIFAFAYGVRGDAIWQFQTEIGTGLPGLTGRQVSIDPNDPSNPDTVAMMDLIERYAGEGRITAVAEGHKLGEMRFDPKGGEWSYRIGSQRTGADLRDLAAFLGETVTITADLPANMSIGGADHQPLLDVDPDARAAEKGGDAPTLPRPFEGESASFRLGAEYVDPAASILVDGDRCSDCSFTPATASNTGKSAIDVTIDHGMTHGVHVMQVLNPSGWASNEMPLCVANIEFGHALPPAGEEACKPYHSSEVTLNANCSFGSVDVIDCQCDPGAYGALRSCAPTPVGKACQMKLFCFGPGDCSDATVTPGCPST